MFIHAYGTDATIIKEFIRAAQEHCLNVNNEGIGIYEMHRWGIRWSKVQQKKCRPIESVVLDRGIARMLIDDIHKFS